MLQAEVRSPYFLWDSDCDSGPENLDSDPDFGPKIRLRPRLQDLLCDILIVYLMLTERNSKFF